jgi:hypothetical protein
LNRIMTGLCNSKGQYDPKFEGILAQGLLARRERSRSSRGLHPLGERLLCREFIFRPRAVRRGDGGGQSELSYEAGVFFGNSAIESPMNSR